MRGQDGKQERRALTKPDSLDLLMVFQRVGRIVCCADRGNPEPFQNAACRHVFIQQALAGVLPDRGGGVFVQQVFNAEIAFQLQVRPSDRADFAAYAARSRPRP